MTVTSANSAGQTPGQAHIAAQAAVQTADAAAATPVVASTKMVEASHDAMSTYRDAVTGVMNLGTVDPTSIRPIGERGISGQLEAVKLLAPEGSTAAPVDALRKPLGARPHNEMVGRGFAEQLGIDHLFAHTAIRDGQIYVEMRPGQTGKVMQVTDGDALLQRLETMHTLDPSNLKGLTPARAAVRDRDLLRANDYLLAMVDRHYRNVMIDDVSGKVTFIDQGFVLPKFGNAVKPYLVSTYMGGDHVSGIFTKTYKVGIGEEAMAVLREKATPDQLLAVLQRETASGESVLNSAKDVKTLHDLQLPETGERLAARASHLIANGSFEYNTNRSLELVFEHGGDAVNALSKLKVGLLHA